VRVSQSRFGVRGAVLARGNSQFTLVNPPALHKSIRDSNFDRTQKWWTQNTQSFTISVQPLRTIRTILEIAEMSLVKPHRRTLNREPRLI
jgi:hypothetical protein